MINLGFFLRFFVNRAPDLIVLKERLWDPIQQLSQPLKQMMLFSGPPIEPPTIPARYETVSVGDRVTMTCTQGTAHCLMCVSVGIGR